MKVLVIAPQPFFTPRGTPFSVYYRTLVTAELGAKVDLLTYGHGQDVELTGVRLIRIPRFAFLGEPRVGPSLLKLFLDGWILLWTLALLIRRRYDFVHAHEEVAFFCRFLKPIFGFRLVYDMHSSLPEQLTNFHFTTSRALIGSFRSLERQALRSSDVVITICPSLAEYALGKIDDASRHFLIENTIFDPVRFAGGAVSADGESAALELPEGSLRIVYTGTLEPYQGIELLLRAFRLVRNEVPNAHLVVVGGSPKQVEGYESLAREIGLEASTRFTGRVSSNVAQAISAQADLLVSPRTEGTNTPSKIYQHLASGIPLVATDIQAHTQVLDASVAFLVRPDPDDLARGLVAGLKDEAARAAKSLAAQQLYEAKYSRSVYVEKMRAVLEKIR